MSLNRAVVITVIDALAFIGFLFVVSTGVLMRYELPPRSGRALEVLGLNRHEWGDVHFVLSILFLSVLAIHLLLHWRFILGVFRGHVAGGSRWRVLLGLVGLLAVLALAAAPLVAPKEETGSAPGRHTGRALH